MIKSLLTTATVILFTLLGLTKLPPDKCPEDQGYPEGDWWCWAIECPGHKYTDDLGCETNLLDQIYKAIKVRIQSSYTS
ncbi:MAG: hypothetical protein WCJ74_01290 [bacterium]